MKIQYIACAASSSVDHKTNELSLFHILDEIGGSTFPLHVANLSIAALFERTPDEDQVQSYLMTISLDDVLLASFSMQVDFARGRRNRCVNKIKGLTIPTPGRVTIRIMQKADVLATWSLAAFRLGTAATPARPSAQLEAEGTSSAAPRPAPTVN